MRLILIRHGQTPSNVHRQLDTAVPGAPLTDLGHQQASALVEALADHQIERIAVSRLIRTQLTAQPLAQARGLTPLITEGFEEITAGSLEMNSDEQSVAIYVETFLAWAAGDLDPAIPGGEDGHTFIQRFDAAIKVAAADVDHLAVVTHGAAIRAWAGNRGQNVDAEDAAERGVSNTGRVILEGDPVNGWKVLDWIRTPAGGVGIPADPADDPTGSPVEEVDEVHGELAG